MPNQLDIAVLAGADRHATEPNALINLTNTATLDEFVDEVREDGHSHVLVIPQSREPQTMRVTNAGGRRDRDTEAHMHGWVRWTDRVLYRKPAGEAVPLTQYWKNCGPPAIVNAFASLIRLAGTHPMRVALRQCAAPVQELVL